MKKLLNKAVKFKPNKNQKEIIEQYVSYRRDLKKLRDDIEKMMDMPGKEVKNKIKHLQGHIKNSEKLIGEIEQNFYDEAKGLWLGLAVDLEDIEKGYFLLYIPWESLHKHFVVYGTTGYGKTRLFATILKQIISFGWNVFAVDPKGGEKQEIAKWLYEFAIKTNRNDSVMRIMSGYPDLSDKLNPIFGMDDEEIASMNVSLVVSGTGIEDASEKYFSGQVFRISLAILYATRFLEKVAYYGQESELIKQIENEAIKYMKMKEMRNMDIEYEDENIILPDFAKVSLNEIANENIQDGISPFSRILISFKELAYFGQYKHLKEIYELVKTYPVPDINNRMELKKIKELQDNALHILEPLINMGEEHYAKVGDTYSVVMSQLAFGSIGKIFTTVRVNPLRFKLKKGGVLTLLEPAPLKFEKVSEMMIKIFVRMFISIFGEIGITGRKNSRRVALLVDEAKPMVFPGIEELYNKARDLGMTIGAFYQSKSDSKLKLGETLKDIIDDNTATQIFMKQISTSSQKEIAESFGAVKVATNMHMGEIDSIEGRNVVSMEEREIITPNQIDKLQIGEAYIRHSGRKYFVKFPYQSDPDDTIEIEMPELESERMEEALKIINSNLNLAEENIANINIENSSEIQGSV